MKFGLALAFYENLLLGVLNQSRSPRFWPSIYQCRNERCDDMCVPFSKNYVDSSHCFRRDSIGFSFFEIKLTRDVFATKR